MKSISIGQRIWLLVGAIGFNLLLLPSIIKKGLDLVGWSTAPGDFMWLLDKLLQIPFPLALFMALAAWMTFFLAPPLWAKYGPLITRKRMPLVIRPCDWHDMKESDRTFFRFHIQVVNTSKTETVEDVSIFLDEIYPVHERYPRTYPAAGDYLLFIDGSKSKTLRPNECAIAEFMSAPEGTNDEEMPVEFGPFSNMAPVKWKDFKAFNFRFKAFSKTRPPHKETLWMSRERGSNGSVFYSDTGEATETDIENAIKGCSPPFQQETANESQ